MNFIGGLLVLLAPSYGNALATVESRTGEPVVSSSTASLPVEERAARLTLTQVETLQKEVSELRGVIEMQDHELKQLKKSMQDYYLDLDKRLVELNPNAAAHKSKIKDPLVNESKNVDSAGTTLDLSKKEAVKPLENNTPNPATPDKLVEKKPTNPEEAYNQAYKFVRSKQYPEAINAFNDYIVRFKEGSHTPLAYYWLGEVYMVQWETDKTQPDLLSKAYDAFKTVTSKFSSDSKAIDSLLKLGLIENERGNLTAAQQYFKEVQDKAPDSPAARVAETQMQ